MQIINPKVARFLPVELYQITPLRRHYGPPAPFLNLTPGPSSSKITRRHYDHERHEKERCHAGQDHSGCPFAVDLRAAGWPLHGPSLVVANVKILDRDRFLRGNFPEPYAGATAILCDELNAGSLKGGADDVNGALS